MIKRPMLAAKTTDADLQKLKWPMLASPKIDGIRAVVVGGKLMSRTMKPIPNKWTQAMFGRPELEGLDGELVVGNPNDPNLMQQTMSGVMSIGGMPKVLYFVFDKWNSPEAFANRLYDVDAQIRLLHKPEIPVIRLGHCLVSSYDELLYQEDVFTAAGYEGIMLRAVDGPYKQNRSTLREGYLLKVKRYQDDEASIINFIPLMRNHNELETDERGYAKRSHSQDNKIADDLLGALVVRCHRTGEVFNLGSGFTESQRIDIWRNRDKYRGATVTYKHFAVTGVVDKPRQPIFKSFRDKIDIA